MPGEHLIRNIWTIEGGGAVSGGLQEEGLLLSFRECWAREGEGWRTKEIDGADKESNVCKDGSLRRDDITGKRRF